MMFIPDFVKLKTGMKEDFSGPLSHDNLLKLRAKMDDMMQGEKEKPCFKKYQQQCDIEEFNIPGGDGQDMIVQVIKPKELKG